MKFEMYEHLLTNKKLNKVQEYGVQSKRIIVRRRQLIIIIKKGEIQHRNK